MAKKGESDSAVSETALAIEQLKKHLDMLDNRLDNLDSMISALVERVMKQPLTINASCPKCGRKIEIALIGVEKPTR